MSQHPGSAAARLIADPDHVRLSEAFPVVDKVLYPAADPYLNLRKALGFRAVDQDFHILGALRCLQAFPQYLDSTGLAQIQELDPLRFFEPPAVQIHGASLKPGVAGPPVIYVTPVEFPTATILTVSWNSPTTVRLTLGSRYWVLPSRYVDTLLAIEGWPSEVHITGQFYTDTWVSGSFFSLRFWPVEFPASLAVQSIEKRFDVKALLRSVQFLGVWLKAKYPEERLAIVYAALLNFTNQRLRDA